MSEMDAPPEILERCGRFILLLSDDKDETDLHPCLPSRPTKSKTKSKKPNSDDLSATPSSTSSSPDTDPAFYVNVLESLGSSVVKGRHRIVSKLNVVSKTN